MPIIRQTASGKNYLEVITTGADKHTDASMLDSDGDSGIEVERTADDDHVRVKTAGTDRVEVDENGISSFLDPPIVANNKTITDDLTIPATKNAVSAGPITVADGKTVTVADGASWTIL